MARIPLRETNSEWLANGLRRHMAGGSQFTSVITSFMARTTSVETKKSPARIISASPQHRQG